MSPLKITLLLNPYCRAVPNGHLTQGEAFSNSMLQAIDGFKNEGVFGPAVSATGLRYGTVGGPALLTRKGMALIDKLMEVEA